MKRKLTIFLTFFLIGIGIVTAQTQVRGTVVDEAGEPAIGATIQIKGTTQGTVTDADGNFTLSAPAGGTLIVSYVGYTTQEVAVSANVRVALTHDAELLEEVVVVAYGTTSTRKLASAVSTVQGGAFKDAANTSLDQALQGRSTGLQVTQPAGIVGQPPIVRIRGVNSISSGTAPLYVVDGIPIATGDLGSLGQANGLADINPNDILSLEVLKDAAAAAMYGSRAANGVVLITTKSGSRDKTKVSYDGWFGISTPTNFMEMMNGQQYTDFKNMSVKNRYGKDNLDLGSGNALTDGRKSFNMMKDASGNMINSRWRDAIFRSGVTHNHTVSISGGSRTSQFFLSANYMNQEGMVIGDKYSRLGLKANGNVNVTSYLKLGINLNATMSKNKAVDAARSGSNFAVGGFPRMGLINPPNIPIYDKDGKPYYDPQGGLGFGNNTVFNAYSNPMQLVEQENHLSSNVNRLISSFYAELNPINGLTLKTQYGFDNAAIEDQRFWSPLHGDGFTANGYATLISAKNNQWVWTNTATYDLALNDHSLNLLAGMEATQTDYSRWGISKSDLTDIKFTDPRARFLIDDATGDHIYSNALLSYFGRINYDYKEKYILSVNYRRDGYSGLGRNKWGNFGGVAAAWRISDEAFMAGVKDMLNDFKLKASWGIVGNTNVGSYPAKTLNAVYFYGSNVAYRLGQFGYPNLKWESSQKLDFGFSARLFNRINIDFDYYKTATKDLILSVPQAPSKGIPGLLVEDIGKIKTNAGQMENSGIEFMIGADLIQTKEFTWHTSFNFTTNSNKVTALTKGLEEILGGDDAGLESTNKTVVGKSIGQLNLFPTKGIDAETGRRIFITPDSKEVLYFREKGGWFFRDGTKYTGGLEQVIAGNTLPTYYGGWTNNFRYKGFDLSLFLQFSGGNKIYNGTKATTSDYRFWNNSIDLLNNYWTPSRKNATYAIPMYGDNVSNGSAYPITDLVESGDYLRLKNVVLGYTLDTKRLPKSLGISTLRFYLQAQNLFVITKYTGLDPEALTNVQDYNLAGGTDKNTMPQARILTMGVNLTF